MFDPSLTYNKVQCKNFSKHSSILCVIIKFRELDICKL
jgi:hypothetical protein